MKTIAQQLKIKEFPFRIKDSNEDVIYFEDSNGFWRKSEFNSNRNLIYFENSEGYWFKCEYDSNRNLIYYENSYGEIIDNRPKIVELTMDDILYIIAKKFGIDVNNLKIKK